MSQTLPNGVTCYDSDTELEFEVEAEALLRHSFDIESRDMAGVNLRAFPISSAGAIAEQRRPVRPPMADPERNDSNLEGNADLATRDFVQTQLREYDDDLSDDDDDVVVIYDSEQEMLGTRRHYNDVFTDSATIASREEVKTRKRRAIGSLVFVGIIAMLYGVGFLLYYADVFLLNVDVALSQRICYLTVLILAILSTMSSHVIINVIGYKWSMFVGCLGVSFFTASRFFSWLPFFVTSSIVCGSTLGPLIAATVTCTMDAARDYAALTGIEVKVVVCYFHAFLNLCTLISPAISVMLRFAFLSSESLESFQNELGSLNCFRDFCWTSEVGLAIYEEDGYNSRSSSQWLMLQALLGCFFGCSLGAAMLSWLEARYLSSDCQRSGSEVWISVADPEPAPRMACKCDCWTCGSYTVLMKETTTVLCHNTMLLLVLLCVYLGVEEYLMYSVFLQSYSQCSSQLFHALMLAINMSLVAAFCSLPTAPMIAQFGRFKVLIPALVTQLALLIALLACKQLEVPAHYIIASFWGAADGVLHNVLTVILFEVFGERTNAALICLKACQLLGYLIVVVLQLLNLCNYAILTFTIALLLLATVCYCILEIRIRIRSREPASMSTQYVPLLDEASWLPHVNPVLVRRETRQPLSSKVPSYSHDS